jgi:7-keto-8-aminopelargonate synthetase-like enzyme
LALEERIEEHFGRPALVFSSGYQANLAVMSTLLGGDMVVGSDALNHASIIDGLRLSSASVSIVPHLSFPVGLDAHVCEGLYSMDGDTPDFSNRKEGLLVVDEAHAVGCFGPGGRGVAASQGVVPDVLIGTFSKAYGAAGAFVVAPEEAKELLVSAGRSFVYTTALAEAAARAALCGFNLATDELRERLSNNVRRFRRGVDQLGLEVRGSHHIVPIVMGDRTMEISQKLLERGVFVPGIRAPTVPQGEERLRFSISAAHDSEAIDRALEALEQCC